MQNHLNDLIERGIAINKLGLNLTTPGTEEIYFDCIMKNLGVVLPIDIIKISKDIDYSTFSTFEFFDTTVGNEDISGIIKNNLELRKEYAKYSNGKSDMSHILALSDNDGGSVFMITQDSPEKPTPIIWCDATDMFHYSVDGKFSHPHDEWPSFTAFFEYLVEKKEGDLKERGLV